MWEANWKLFAMKAFPSSARFWFIYIKMMVSLFIYKKVAFAFLAKSMTSRQAVHKSSVLTFLFYAHITTWDARELVVGTLLTALEHQDLELWRCNMKRVH